AFRASWEHWMPPGAWCVTSNTTSSRIPTSTSSCNGRPERNPGQEVPMSGFWNGTAGLVTGAASGIGLELSKALAARGARVWMADVDAERLARAVSGMGDAAVPVVLDV